MTWNQVTDLGDSAVLLPLALMLFAWVWSTAETKYALAWAVAFGSTGALVCASKLAYLGWGLGIPHWDFRGFSGHTALSTLAYPALLWLLLNPQRDWHRRATLGVGLALGGLIGWSRIEVHAHTVSEVVSGFVLGGAGAAVLVNQWRTMPRLPGVVLPVSTLVVYIGSFQLGRAPTQALLLAISQRLSAVAF